MPDNEGLKKKNSTRNSRKIRTPIILDKLKMLKNIDVSFAAYAQRLITLMVCSFRRTSFRASRFLLHVLLTLP